MMEQKIHKIPTQGSIMVAQKKRIQEEQLNQSQGSSNHLSSEDEEGFSFGESFIIRKLN